jgi:Protein of unknown function (DUF3800)
MILAYLDEFGHVGPYFGRGHARFNHSPVFGLAGIILPEDAVRQFASFFLHRKTDLLGFDIQRSGKEPYEWEKHGTNLYTPRSIIKYPQIRQTTFRIINGINRLGGRIFYYGREKIKNTENVNPNGLYKTVFSEAIRRLDRYCAEQKQNFAIVVDENAARKELLVTAVKTMYGSDPTYHLASPPFEVESYLNQNIQAADWVAAVIGRLWCHRLEPDNYQDLAPYRTYFDTRIHAVATHSTVMERPKPKTLRVVKTAMAAAYESAIVVATIKKS